MDARSTFEFRRRSDGLACTFDRSTKDGAGGACFGRPRNVLPRDWGDSPPERDRVSREGDTPYVCRLAYVG